MYFHDPKTRATKELVPGIITRTFWGEKMLIGVVDLEANTEVPLHSHSYEQISFVLKGELEFTIADETTLLKAGQLAVIPGGAEHMAKTGDQPAKVIDIFSPAREDYKY
jgi:quercetin dioxygenase-like cupin family protein